ncbi:response regulator [Paenibacillus sp. GD4]|uniref:response regulator n=1 Tax=Paenibacillus TaxID=44249 RepID=UPI0025437F83|nr:MULTISPECIES: response regulator [Paenibacillus]MDQ1911748.1 response regulator [Paenibacillus sp. GD4]
MIRSKVLIVEDSSATRDYYRTYLTERGFVVSEAFNGLEALEKMAVESFDAAIVDINMPKMDGYQFIRELRGGEQKYNTPIAVISSENKPSDQHLAYQAGANAYLVKPVRPDQLESLIRLFGVIPEGESR